MERLPGLLNGEPVYWIESVTALGSGRVRSHLGFSDAAGHPYQDLVVATVEMLEKTPGIEEVVQDDRDVVLVVSRRVTPETIGELVDRFWFERLPTAPVDPEYETDPAELLQSPWPSAPPKPRGQLPAVEPVLGAAAIDVLRAAGALPPSRRRMWMFLICGAIPAAGGVAMALTPGGSSGVAAMGIGAINLIIGTRIAQQRKQVGLPAI